MLRGLWDPPLVVSAGVEGEGGGKARFQRCVYPSYGISNHSLQKFIRILSQRHFILLSVNSHPEHVLNLLPEGFAIQIIIFIYSYTVTNFQNGTMF